MRPQAAACCLLIAILMTVSGADRSILRCARADGDSPTPETPPVEVVGCTGEVTIADEGGGVMPVKAGHRMNLRQTLSTGKDGRAAMELMNVAEKRPAEPFHLTLGPGGSIQRLIPDASSEHGWPTVLRLHQGLCRVAADKAGAGAPVTILIGPLKIDVRGADVVFNYEPAKARLTCLVSEGELTVPVLEREIRVLPGKKRTFFGDTPRGSSGFEEQEWMDLLRRMIVPGLRWTDPDKVKVTELVRVRVVTSRGDFVLELDATRAPVTVANFLSYVDDGFYAGTIFHRVIRNFMIQAGGYDQQYERKVSRGPIKNEWTNGLKNVRGSISMARVGGRPDSATSQFFVSVRDNPGLDRPQRDGAAYAVFGRVVDGMEVVDAIAAVQVVPSRLNPREHSEPVEPVVNERMERVERFDSEESEAQ